MWPIIQAQCAELIKGFEGIPEERKKLLSSLATYISQHKENKVQLTFICTHNSRRSHFGQIWAAVAASYYGVSNVFTYSGGTEATAFHVNARQALLDLGFHIEVPDVLVNPPCLITYGDSEPAILCFSKEYLDAQNPSSHFAAIMTCGEAEANCPFIPGAELRIATTYRDPKEFDDTALQAQMYHERCKQIGTELLYTFSLVK